MRLWPAFHRKAVLCGVFLAAVATCVQAAPPAAPSEARTARYMESVRKNPGLLYAFLREMPKGGDLHSHLWGAVYAESFIEWAAGGDYCVDSRTYALLAPPCKAMTNAVPASTALSDPVLYRNMVDAYSMRNWKLSGQSGHDHFFDTFDKFAPVASVNTGKMMAETASRAASQHVIYQELMHTFTGDAFNEMVQKTPWTDDLVQMQKTLTANGMAKAFEEARHLADAADSERNTALRCSTPVPDAGCTVVQRYLFQVLRGLPRNIVFAQMMLGFELATSDPRFAGINLVMPEDYRIPMEDFTLHMRMLQYLHGVYPKAHISLHAGELAIGLVPPEGLQYHIRDSVETGHAERIGHGVDVMQENQPFDLLREMAERKIMVEICLTSNDTILGVTGKDHPLHQYMRAGVPVALATDDEGVSRSDMTIEFLKGVQEQDLTYSQLKGMTRTSLEYAFVPGASLWSNTQRYVPVKECSLDKLGATPPSIRCQNFLNASDKARVQWKLEKEFRDFESRTWPPVSAGSAGHAAAP